MEKKDLRNVDSIAFDAENDRALFVSTSGNKVVKGKIPTASLTKSGLMSGSDKMRLPNIQTPRVQIYKLGTTSGWQVLTLHLTFQNNSSSLCFSSFFVTAYAANTNDTILSYTVSLGKKGIISGVKLFCENANGIVSIYLQVSNVSTYLEYKNIFGTGYLEVVEKDLTGLQEIAIP